MNIKISPSELLEIFPEAIPVIKKNLRQWQNDYEECELWCSQLLDGLFQLIYIYDTTPEEKNQMINDATMLFYDRPLSDIKKQVNRLSHLLKIYEWRRKPILDGSITDKEIAMAKDIPFSSLIQLNNHNFARCPFHNEKTPSFKVFKDNRYHCFGCQADGDTIDFIMKRDNIDFFNAVKFLIKN